MLPWASGTVAGGSYGERGQGERALISSERPQGQLQTPDPVPTQLGGACPDPMAMGILLPALWFPAHQL